MPDVQMPTVQVWVGYPGASPEQVENDVTKPVENAVNTVAGISGSKVNLTFDPPWDQSRMSDEARLALNMF